MCTFFCGGWRKINPSLEYSRDSFFFFSFLFLFFVFSFSPFICFYTFIYLFIHSFRLVVCSISQLQNFHNDKCVDQLNKHERSLVLILFQFAIKKKIVYVFFFSFAFCCRLFFFFFWLFLKNYFHFVSSLFPHPLFWYLPPSKHARGYGLCVQGCVFLNKILFSCLCMHWYSCLSFSFLWSRSIK